MHLDAVIGEEDDRLGRDELGRRKSRQQEVASNRARASAGHRDECGEQQSLGIGRQGASL